MIDNDLKKIYAKEAVKKVLTFKAPVVLEILELSDNFKLCTMKCVLK